MSGIYLAFTNPEAESIRADLFNTLQKAGQQVYPSNLEYDTSFFPHISEEIDKSSASLHILRLTYGDDFNGMGISLLQHQYNEALKKLERDPDFKILIWFPFHLSQIEDPKQINFINNIRNNIKQNIHFSNVGSPIQLVDDLRLSMKQQSKQKFEINPTDVFLIYNQLDDMEASDVADMLSDIIPVEKLNIVQDSDIDYSEYCAQQINKSKLAVVYFKESADWALPFTQQIWKKIGGASSHTPILLIGDEDPETNVNKKFKAPKVVSLIIAGELVPLEIKVQYDKVIEGII